MKHESAKFEKPIMSTGSAILNERFGNGLPDLGFFLVPIGVITYPLIVAAGCFLPMDGSHPCQHTRPRPPGSDIQLQIGRAALLNRTWRLAI